SFFFNDTATTEVYPLSLHDAFRSISHLRRGCDRREHSAHLPVRPRSDHRPDRKSTRLNSIQMSISYAVLCLKKTSMDEAKQAVPGPPTDRSARQVGARTS